MRLALVAMCMLTVAGSLEAANGKRKHSPVGTSAKVQQAAPAVREPFDAREQALARIPGIPDARFWGDSETDFVRALPPSVGSWLILSAGGSDGAFGAGLISGLTQSGRRPEYVVVTGVSAGALLAPFAFAGPRYDRELRDAFTTITASDVFEAGGNGESLNDTWPLKALIAKRITTQLLADVAMEHRRGRRLFVTTTDLDAGRSVVWNMGAIAERGDEAALQLFRDVLLASASLPGLFPPVYIDATARKRRIREMHVDGGIGAPFFVAPPTLLLAPSSARLPASELHIIVNGKLTPTFQMVTRETGSILGRAISTAFRSAVIGEIGIVGAAARRQGIGFRLAYVDSAFDHPSRGPFDPDNMKALFEAGLAQGTGAQAFQYDCEESPRYGALVGTQRSVGATDASGATDGGGSTACGASSWIGRGSRRGEQ